MEEFLINEPERRECFEFTLIVCNHCRTVDQIFFNLAELLRESCEFYLGLLGGCTVNIGCWGHVKAIWSLFNQIKSCIHILCTVKLQLAQVGLHQDGTLFPILFSRKISRCSLGEEGVIISLFWQSRWLCWCLEAVTFSAYWGGSQPIVKWLGLESTPPRPKAMVLSIENGGMLPLG